MDVVINPTSACNFACKFCAASNMPRSMLSSKETISLLDRFRDKLSMIVINGGDPLMMDPQYYYDILEWCRTDLMRFVPMSFTSNLLDFYNHPEKWIGLFNEKEVGVITSFQYGDKRGYIREGKYIVYDEGMFREISDSFLSYIGYRPSFIYVVDQDNEQYLEKAIELALELGIDCKINKAVTYGRQKTYYPRYKLFSRYLELIQKYGKFILMDDSMQFHRFFNGLPMTMCDLDRYCYYNMSTITTNGQVVSCPNLAYLDKDEISSRYDICRDEYNRYKFRTKYYSIRTECKECEYFDMCNSCAVYIREVKDNGDELNYCSEMKKILGMMKNEYRENE